VLRPKEVKETVMPNRQQEENPQPQRRQNLNPDTGKPIDFEDEPPPVITAAGENEAGEGEADLARDEDVESLEEQDEADENEGEGNRTADRNYREGVQKHLKTKDVQQEGEEAKEALEDESQRQDLEDAEQAARKGQIH
jgi:hypothetical protein